MEKGDNEERRRKKEKVNDRVVVGFLEVNRVKYR